MTSEDDNKTTDSQTQGFEKDAEAAWSLRARALEEAQNAIRGHLERAAELRRAALVSAREQLGGDPSLRGLLQNLEASLAPTTPPDLSALLESLSPTSVNPLQAMDQLMLRRQQSLDESMRRFMQQGGVAPTSSMAPHPPRAP